MRKSREPKSDNVKLGEKLFTREVIDSVSTPLLIDNSFNLKSENFPMT